MEQLQELLKEWHSLVTEEEKIEFDKRFKIVLDSLSSSDKLAFASAFESEMNQSIDEASYLIELVDIRKELETILKYVSLSGIAEEYFKKSRQWLYQRLNNNIVNGKPAKFTKEEIRILSDALLDISEKIRVVAQNIK